MKVLLCIRGDYMKNFAGDSMQVIKFAQHLRKKGVEADINNGGILDYSKYDIIHLFNIISLGETYKYYKLAHEHKKTIVVSPLYWSLKRYYEYKGDFDSLALWDKCKVYRNEILKGCSAVYTNCNLEGELLRRDYKFDAPETIIHCGVEVENEDIPLYNFKERYSLDNYVLSVGRICHMKNQLTLAKICSELGVSLVLIGKVEDKIYFSECRKYEGTIYLGFINNYDIYNAYRFARLHVLPSFSENPGISSLEAAAAGCNVVSTTEGIAKEYLKDMAVYCDPYNEESIFSAVKNSMRTPKNKALKEHILRNYTWEKCTEKLYESYLNII